MRLRQTQTGLSLFPAIVTAPPAPPLAVPGPFVPVDLSDPIKVRARLQPDYLYNTNLYKVPPPPLGSMVWLPGHIGRTGSGNSTGFRGQLPTVLSFIQTAIAADINNQLRGFCVPAQWADLEGPTANLYDGSWATGTGFSGVQQIIDLLKSFAFKRYLMISLNQTGNGAGANNNAAFPATFAPNYLGVGGSGNIYDGGCEWGGRSGYSGYPNVNTTLWNTNTALRVAAMVVAYYNHFGPFNASTGDGIYMWELTNEISLQTTSMISGGALVNAINNGYATIRNTAKDMMLCMRPTFVNPGTAGNYQSILQAMFNAKIAMANEDGSNNFMGTNPHAAWCDQAYAGQGTGPGNGLTNYSLLNTWTHIFNIENAELGRRNAILGAVPPADVGSGYIYDAPTVSGMMGGADFLNSSHIIWFFDGQQGPNVNRFKFPVTNGTQPADPSPGPGAGLTTARPHMIDVITGNTSQPGVTGIIPLPNIIKPTGW